VADPAPVDEICASCGYRAIEDDKTGWCLPCSANRVVEAYAMKEAQAIAKRRKAWRKRTTPVASDSAEALRERQRKHRLYAALQPRERPPREADPWELAREALKHLQMVRPAARGDRARAHLAEVAEIIRQLAVGPDD